MRRNATFFVVCSLAVGMVACSVTQTRETSNETVSAAAQPSPTVDPIEARKLSDAMVDDFIHDRRSSLRVRMERGFQDYYDDDSFGKILDQMATAYGRPLEVAFKMYQGGWKSAAGYSKPVQKFWSATRTPAYAKGTIFITVEIVPD